MILRGSDGARPWEPRDDETEEEYALLASYLGWPDENLDAWARALPAHLRAARTVGGLRALAVRMRWRARRRALKHHLCQVQFGAMERAAEAQGASLGAIWAEAVDWVMASVLDAKARGVTLSPRDALAFLRAAQEHANLEAGKPTIRIDLAAIVPEAVPAAVVERLEKELAAPLEGD